MNSADKALELARNQISVTVTIAVITVVIGVVGLILRFNR